MEINEFIEKIRLLLWRINNLGESTASTLQNGYKWHTSDTRIVYFNSLSEIAFNHGLTLYFIETEIGFSSNSWRENQRYFKPTRTDAFDRILKYYPFQIRDNFFFDFVNLLEHTLRIFSNDLISFKTESISAVKNKLIDELPLDTEYKKLIDVTFKIRNTIHNGGLNSKMQQPIIFKDRQFDFIEKSFSNSSLENLDFLFSEILSFMITLFKHEKSLSKLYIRHPYKDL